MAHALGRAALSNTRMVPRMIKNYTRIWKLQHTGVIQGPNKAKILPHQLCGSGCRCTGTAELLRGTPSSQLSVWLETLRPMLACASQRNIITVEVSGALKQKSRDLLITG